MSFYGTKLKNGTLCEGEKKKKKKKENFGHLCFETMLVKCHVYSSCKNFQRKQSRKLICINFEVSTIGWEIQ